MDFSWDAMAGNLEPDAFNEKKTYDDVDTRFWKLGRNENGDGGAIVRFIPDSEGVPFVKMVKINARTKKKGFFVNDWSPQSIKLPCPFNDEFSKMWDAGDKEVAKTLGRQFRFITNVKIIKDPANPENEGKIFLYEMSSSMMEDIKEVMIQTEAMKALDETPIAVYNPLAGNNFLLKVKNGDNGIPTYSSSKFSDKVTPIYDSMAEAEKDLVANAYRVGEFHEESFFKTYKELTAKLDKFLKRGKFAEGGEAKAETPKPEVEVETVDTGLNLSAKTEAKAESTPDELDDEIANMLDEIA